MVFYGHVPPARTGQINTNKVGCAAAGPRDERDAPSRRRRAAARHRARRVACSARGCPGDVSGLNVKGESHVARTAVPWRNSLQQQTCWSLYSCNTIQCLIWNKYKRSGHKALWKTSFCPRLRPRGQHIADDIFLRKQIVFAIPKERYRFFKITKSHVFSPKKNWLKNLYDKLPPSLSTTFV